MRNLIPLIIVIALSCNRPKIEDSAISLARKEIVKLVSDTLSTEFSDLTGAFDINSTARLVKQYNEKYFSFRREQVADFEKLKSFSGKDMDSTNHYLRMLLVDEKVAKQFQDEFFTLQGAAQSEFTMWKIGCTAITKDSTEQSFEVFFDTDINKVVKVIQLAEPPLKVMISRDNKQ